MSTRADKARHDDDVALIYNKLKFTETFQRKSVTRNLAYHQSADSSAKLYAMKLILKTRIQYEKENIYSLHNHCVIQFIDISLPYELKEKYETVFFFKYFKNPVVSVDYWCILDAHCLQDSLVLNASN